MSGKKWSDNKAMERINLYKTHGILWKRCNFQLSLSWFASLKNIFSLKYISNLFSKILK